MDLEPKTTRPELTLARGSGLVLELGFVIAIPVCLLGFGGAVLDRELHTSPLLMLLGFALSVAISSVAVYRMIKRLDP